MSIIQVSARMKIPSGRLEEFKQQASEILKQVKQKDVGTLHYDWFLNNDKTECEIREGYESSEAALKHQSNLHEALGLFFQKFGSVPSITIYGDPSPELLDVVKTGGLDITIFSLLQGL